MLKKKLKRINWKRNVEERRESILTNFLHLLKNAYGCADGRNLCRRCVDASEQNREKGLITNSHQIFSVKRNKRVGRFSSIDDGRSDAASEEGKR
jgi:hypothetical protein